MSGGMWRVDILNKDGSSLSMVQHNQVSNRLVYSILESMRRNATPANFAYYLHLSDFPNAWSYTDQTLTPFTGYTNYGGITPLTYTSGYDWGPDSSAFSVTQMNASNYPCVACFDDWPFKRNISVAYTWDSERFYIRKNFAFVTNLSQNVDASGTRLYLDDVTGFKVGWVIHIPDFKGDEYRKVSAIGANYIDVVKLFSADTDGVALSHLVGCSVYCVGSLVYTIKALLTQNSNSGTNVIYVEDSDGFSNGQKVMLYKPSDDTMEGLTISTAVAGTITFTTNLTNPYSTGNEILCGFTTGHSASDWGAPGRSGSFNNTVFVNRYSNAYRYTEWYVDDLTATGFGTSPIKNISTYEQSESYMSAAYLLGTPIYKDGASNIKTIRISYTIYLVAG